MSDREALIQINAISAAALAVPPVTPPVQPPVQPPVTPPTILPGNSGAILPPIEWLPGAPQSVIYQMRNVPNGLILCWEVPQIPEGWPAAIGVHFTQGQGTSTQGQVTTIYSISQTPGVMFPDGGPYYIVGKAGQNPNEVVINRATGAMPYCPAGQKWYINMTWTNPNNLPNGYSLQWALAA